MIFYFPGRGAAFVFPFVDFRHRIHFYKIEIPPAQCLAFSRLSFEIFVCIVRTFGLSVLLVYYITNSWFFISIAGLKLSEFLTTNFLTKL